MCADFFLRSGAKLTNLRPEVGGLLYMILEVDRPNDLRPEEIGSLYSLFFTSVHWDD